MHCGVGALYALVWFGSAFMGVGIVLIAVGVGQIRVATSMRTGHPHALARATLIAGITAAVLSLNPINAIIAGFGYLQLSQPDVVAWLAVET